MLRNLMYVVLSSLVGATLATTQMIPALAQTRVSDSRNVIGANGNRSTRQIQGATLDNINIDPAQRLEVRALVRGVVVTDVDPASPAGFAGLLPGDVILAVQFVPVQSITQLQDTVWRLGVNPVIFTVVRQGISYPVTILLR
jgi:S1-C subfamily serine protease